MRVRPARLDFLPECLRDEQVDLLVSPLGRRQALQEHEQRVEVRPLEQLSLPLLDERKIIDK